MSSKTLLRLIDETIVPTLVLIVSKIGGLLLVSVLFGLEVGFQNFTFNFSNKEEFLIINSYSNLVMYLSLALGFGWVVVRALYFHDTHVHPGLSARLISRNLTSLLVSSVKIYHQALIWWLYVLFITLLFLIQSYFSLMFTWVTVLSLFVTVGLTWLFIYDVEKDLKLAEKQGKVNLEVSE